MGHEEWVLNDLDAVGVTRSDAVAQIGQERPLGREPVQVVDVVTFER